VWENTVPEDGDQPTSPAWELLYATLAAAPFLSLYLAHYLLLSESATGFLLYDMPYYSAHGREVFERGNGFAHPNPYDPDPMAPAIYWHWFPWLLGFGITKLGLDPGVQFVMLGIVGALVCSWVTLRLVEAVLPYSGDPLPGRRGRQPDRRLPSPH
jgi:hypothetical protein